MGDIEDLGFMRYSEILSQNHGLKGLKDFTD